MAGGIRIPKRFRLDMDKAVDLLNKARDNIILDSNPEKTQKYIEKANEICKKYID
jgi:cytidylate kinase